MFLRKEIRKIKTNNFRQVSFCKDCNSNEIETIQTCKKCGSHNIGFPSFVDINTASSYIACKASLW